MNVVKCWVHSFVISILALMISSCTYFQDEPMDAQLLVKAAKDINPNREGASSPLEIRVYLLADKDSFRHFSFIELYLHDRELLGAKLLYRLVLEDISPGATYKWQLPNVAGGKYVGVLGAFADYEEAGRSCTSIAPYPQGGGSITIEISKTSIRAISRDKKGVMKLEQAGNSMMSELFSSEISEHKKNLSDAINKRP